MSEVGFAARRGRARHAGEFIGADQWQLLVSERPSCPEAGEAVGWP